MARLLCRRSTGRALAAEPAGDPFDRLDAVGAGAESGDPEIAFAARPEAGAGHAYHLGLREKPVEEVPGRDAGRRADPDIRSVPSAVHDESGSLQPLADDARVVHVLVDQRSNLLLALRGVDGGRRALHDIRRAVRLRGLPPEPELIEAHLVARRRAALSLARYDGVGHAQAGEAGVLREAARLDGHLPRPLDLIDRMQDLGIPDICLVG